MRWWDYAGLVMAMAASAGLGGLMGAWAAERRLDRLQARELYRPKPSTSPEGPSGMSRKPPTRIDIRVVNPQAASDAAEEGR